MKTALLTAVSLGAAIAGLILYTRKKNRPANRIEDAAKDAYQTMNGALGSVERPAQHAMG